jgi:hypothetical protein
MKKPFFNQNGQVEENLGNLKLSESHGIKTGD